VDAFGHWYVNLIRELPRNRVPQALPSPRQPCKIAGKEVDLSAIRRQSQIAIERLAAIVRAAFVNRNECRA
jgi:hypothetical protein